MGIAGAERGGSKLMDAIYRVLYLIVVVIPEFIVKVFYLATHKHLFYIEEIGVGIAIASRNKQDCMDYAHNKMRGEINHLGYILSPSGKVLGGIGHVTPLHSRWGIVRERFLKDASNG